MKVCDCIENGAPRVLEYLHKVHFYDIGPFFRAVMKAR